MDDHCIEIGNTGGQSGSYFVKRDLFCSFTHLHSFALLGRYQEIVFGHVEFEVHLRYLCGAVR